MSTAIQLKPRRLVRKTEILERLGNSSQASGYRHVFNHPDFPKAVSLLPGVDLFDESEIDDFIEKLLAEREAGLMDVIESGAITAVLEEMADSLTDIIENNITDDHAILDELNNLAPHIRSVSARVLDYEVARQKEEN